MANTGKFYAKSKEKAGKHFKRNIRLSYKQVVYLCLMAVILLLIFVFVTYSYVNYLEESKAAAIREAADVSSKVVAQVDERLNNLRQYYNSKVAEDDVKWVIENRMDYSDYNEIKAARDAFSSTLYLDGYVRGYTFVNYRTGWIMSHKGMFPRKDAINGEELLPYFDDEDVRRENYYWSYDGEEAVSSRYDRNYRRMLELDGLKYVMRLPNGYNSYAMLVVNINMDTWQKWMKQSLGAGEQLAVMDEERGEVIYASSPALKELMLSEAVGEEMPQGQIWRLEGEKYVARSAVSNILGWRYYVFHDLSLERSGFSLSFFWVVTIFGMAFLLFLLAAYIIYRPIGTLVKDVMADGEGIHPAENEFDFLTGSFKSLRGDNELLQTMINQSKDRLMEIFELRLIKGEIRRAEDWQEYIKDFGLQERSYYATVVSILELSEEEIQSNVKEDIICLKLVEEMPEAIRRMPWMPPVYNSYTIYAIFAEDDEGVLLERIREFYQAMQEYSQKISGYKLLMGVSANHTEPRHIQVAYRESIKALTYPGVAYRETDGRENELLENCRYYLSSTTMRTPTGYESGFERDVQAGIKALDKDQCYKATDSFCHRMWELNASQYENMIFTIRFVNAILFTAMEVKVDLDAIYPQGIRRLYSELLDAFEPSRTRRFIKMHFIDPIIEARSKMLDEKSYSMLEEIEKMIAQSKGDISLAQCADALNVHPTYIWKILKMNKDKSFSDCLEEYKLEEAKKLLLNTALSVAEIATELNYTNAQNFIRFFNKKVGVTPGKYRKLYG